MRIWQKNIEDIIYEIDSCIKNGDDEALTLSALSKRLGYSEYYVSRKFREISGMQLRDYLRLRRLSFALKQIRDGEKGILEIALKYGFSSNEAFTRAFKEAYGATPSEYRKNARPIVLQTVIRPFDCYLLEADDLKEGNDVKAYFVTIPAHKFLHIRNYESIGYWDFWQKQSLILGQDFKTVCGLLKSIPGILDVPSETDGQIMAFINAPEGRLCSWGIPLAEAYGVRLPEDYSGKIPEQMQIMDVSCGDYIVFEHGPFDFETQNAQVEAKMERAMRDFDYKDSGFELDVTEERVFYFYHECDRFWKYIRPVKRTAK